MLKQFKNYNAKVETDEAERSITAIISSAAIDRDREVLLPKGANFEQFQKNPVVQWAHQYDTLPIGKALWVKTGTKNGQKVVMAKWQPAPKPEGHEGDWFPDTVYNLYKDGYLSAFSVGFITNDSHPPTPDEIKKNPEWAEVRRVYADWDLLEFSAVPVPANPEALATAVKTKAITLTDDLQKELGVEIEEEVATEPEPVVVGTEPVVKTKKTIELQAVIPTDEVVDVSGYAKNAVKKLQGKMY